MRNPGISGGNLSQSLKAGLIAGVTAFAFYEVGSATNWVQGIDPNVAHVQPQFGTDAYAFNIAGHALVGCASAAASGGSCESGALSGAIAASAAPFVSKNFAVATVESAVLGGVGSVAGGGKFANGAITGAFGYLFNQLSGTFDRKTGLLTLTDQDTGQTVTGSFFTGGVGGAAIPAGTFDILDRAGKDEFRLEAEDNTFGDDQEDSSGRGLFRLHGPGVSNGCITACDIENWSAIRDLINATSTGTATVNTYYGPSFFGGVFQPFRIQTGIETLKNYGTITVK